MDLINKISISPEQEIVFHAIRIDHVYDSRIEQLLESPLDWSFLREFALQQGVLPQLYLRLKTLEDNQVPKRIPVDEMKELKALYLANAKRNLRLARLFLSIFDLLSGEGIQLIPIKGPILAEYLYCDTSLRQFTDLDILIQRKDFRRTYQTLTKAGFIPCFPMSHDEETWLLRSDWEHQFIFKGDILDVHWAVAQKGVRYPLKEARFWENLHAVDLYERRFNSLSPENLFLMICVHGTKHQWAKLIWIADLARFIKANPAFDWHKIIKLSTKLGFHRSICLSLLMAERFGGVQLSPEINGRLRTDIVIEQLSQEAFAAILSGSPDAENTKIGYYLRSRERIRDRAYFILDQTFIPKQIDWQTISLPAVLYPLYYLIRPIRLFYKLIIMRIIQWKAIRTRVIF